jgi:hypothetical protein
MILELSKNALKQIQRMKYHQLMSRKHKKQARFRYTILVKIFNHDEDALKKVLKQIGEENDSFSKGDLK